MAGTSVQVSRPNSNPAPCSARARLPGRGRMVIAPGSRPCRQANTATSTATTLADLAPLPGSVLAKLKRSAGQQRLDTWSAKIEATPEGDRHRVVRDACWALAHDVVAASSTRPSSAAVLPTWRQPACRRWTGSTSRTRSRAHCARCAPKTGSARTSRTASPTFTLPDFEPADEPAPIARTLTASWTRCSPMSSWTNTRPRLPRCGSCIRHCLEATDYTPRLLITRRPAVRQVHPVARDHRKLVPRPLPLSAFRRRCCFARSVTCGRRCMLDEADNAGLNDNRGSQDRTQRRHLRAARDRPHGRRQP